MTAKATFPAWVEKRIEQNPAGFLAGVAALPGAAEKSRRPATLIEVWAIVDTLKAHALRLQERIETLERQGPELRYCGVWREGNAAERGNFYTHQGSIWHANEPTTTKPGTSDSWTLACKHGRDANPAEIAARLLPEVKKVLKESGR